MLARATIFAVLLASLLVAGCGSGSPGAPSGAASTPTAAAERLMDAVESGDAYNMIQVLADTSDTRSAGPFTEFWTAPALPSYVGPMMERHLSYDLGTPVVEEDTARIPAEVVHPNWNDLQFFIDGAFTPVLILAADSAAPGYYQRYQARRRTLFREGARAQAARDEGPIAILRTAVKKERPDWFYRADSMVADYPRQIKELFGDGPDIEEQWTGHIVVVRSSGGWKPLGLEN